MSTSPPKVLLDPSIFMQAAITVKDVEDEKAVQLSCNLSLFEHLDDLSTNHELFISSNFMSMFLKITDELKQLKGNSAFYVPIYALWRLFGIPVGKKKKDINTDADDDPARYAAICDAHGANMQAFIDVADRIRAIFRSKRLKQYAFRANIGRGYQTAGPALLKRIDAVYQPALKVKNAKDSGDCNPDKIEKIFEDIVDFVELDGPLVAESKQAFELLQAAGIPTSTERKPNPDLVDRDRSFLKDKFKGVKSRGFRYFISKLKLGKLILVDLKDPLLT
jgi:hypothetical protein